MTVAVLVPIHDKPQETIEAVLCGLQHLSMHPLEDDPAFPHGRPLIAQLIFVFDRTPGVLREATSVLAAQAMHPGVKIVEIDASGPPGWRSPCIAANAGLAKVTADVTIYNPSDVVQAPGNIAKVKAHFEAHPNSVLFGRVTESNPELCVGPGHAGPVLQGTDNLRPMTFLTAYPTAALRAIGGWDEAFQDGVCYEDDDLAARLWKHGLGFVFDDAFSGVHQTHSRAYFLPIRIAPNMAHMLRKHGRISGQDVVMQSKPLIVKEPGRVTWKHAKHSCL